MPDQELDDTTLARIDKLLRSKDRGGLSVEDLALLARLGRGRRQALVRVGSARLQSRALALSAFNIDGVPLFVLLLASGDVGVGRIDSKSRGLVLDDKSLRLSGFDADKHEVVSFTASPRRLSRRYDLYLVLRRRSRSPADRPFTLYRGSIGLDQDGELELRRGLDHRVTGPADWAPVDLQDGMLPQWLSVCPISVPNVDPFPALKELALRFGEDFLEAAAEVVAADYGQVLNVAVLGETLVFGTCEDLLVRFRLGHDPNVVDAQVTKGPGWPRVLLARRNAGSKERRPRDAHLSVVVGTSAGVLLRFDESFDSKSRQLEEVWRFRLRGQGPLEPAAAAVVDVDEQPQLLVASDSGDLLLLRWSDPDRQRERWAALLHLVTGGIPADEFDWVGWVQQQLSASLNTGRLPGDSVSRMAVAALVEVLIDRYIEGDTNRSRDELRLLDLLRSPLCDPIRRRIVDAVVERLEEAAKLLEDPAERPRDVARRRYTATGYHQASASWWPQRRFLAVLRSQQVALIQRSRQRLVALLHRYSSLADAAVAESVDEASYRGCIPPAPRPSPATHQVAEARLSADRVGAHYERISCIHVPNLSARRALAVVAGDRRWLLIIGRRTFRLLSADAQLSSIPDGLEYRLGAREPILRALGVVPTAGGDLVVVGGQDGQAAILDPLLADGGRCDVGAIGSCWGIHPLPPAANGLSRVLLGWTTNGHTLLELYGVHRDGAQFRVTRRAVTRVEGFPAFSQAMGRVNGVQWLALGHGRSTTVILAELGLSGPFAEEKLPLKEKLRLEMPGAVRALAIDPQLGGRLVVGTQNGFVLCYRLDGTLVWSYRARGLIRSLDLASGASQDEAWVAFISAPHGLYLLDAQGRRIWRKRLHATVSGVSFTAPDAEGRRELLVAQTNGIVSTYAIKVSGDDVRTAALTDLRRGLDGLSPQVIDHQLADAAELYAAWTRPIADDATQLLARLRFRRNRLVWLLRIAGEPRLGPGILKQVAQHCTLRELGRMMGSIPQTTAAAARGEVLFKTILARCAALECGGQGDDSPQAAAMALAEAMRWPVGDGWSVARVASRIGRLPLRLVEQDLWLAISAAHAWCRALGLHPEKADVAIEALVGTWGQVPAPVLAACRYVVQAPALAGCVKALAGAMQTTPDEQPDRVALRAVIEALESIDQRGPSCRLLIAVLRIRAPAGDLKARWSALQALLVAAQEYDARSEDSLLQTWAHLLLPYYAAGIPAGDWPLVRARRWLQSAAERYPAPDRALPRWSEQLTTALFDVIRAVCREWLPRLERRTRPFPVVSSLRVRGGEATTTIKLTAEGQRALHEVEVIVEVRATGGGGESDAPPIRETFHRQLFVAGEPAELLQFNVPLVNNATELMISTDVVTMDEYASSGPWTWRHPLPTRPASVSPGSASPLGELPDALIERRVARAEAANTPHVIFSMEMELGAERLIGALSGNTKAIRVDLDAALSVFGPGRTYPRDFNAGTVLALLSHREPFDAGPPRFAPATERSVIYPCESSVERLLAAPFADEWHVIRRALRGATRSQTLYWILPVAEASRLHGALGDRSTLIRYGRVEPTERETVEQWLSSVLALEPREAQRLLRGAEFDLNVLSRAGSPSVDQEKLSDAIYTMGCAELATLPSQVVLAALAFAGATTRVPIGRLQPGMIAAETVRSAPLVGRSKELVKPGQVLTESTIQSRLSRARSRRQVLSCQGVHERWELEVAARGESIVGLLAERRALMEELAKHDLASTAGGLLILDPLLERAIKIAYERADGDIRQVFQRVTGGQRLLDALPIERIGNIDDDVAERMLGFREPSRRAVLRAAGRLWGTSEKAPHAASLAVVASAWFGAGQPVVLSPDHPIVIATGLDAVTAVAIQRPGLQATWFLIWLSDVTPSSYAPLRNALMETSASCVAVIAGPAVGPTSSVEDPQVVVLGEPAVRALLIDTEPSVAFWAIVQAHQGGLSRLSPFVESGALPSGSPVFVGRRRLRAEITSSVLQRSYLILGARRIGKTSLINQLKFELGQRDDIELRSADLQGVSTDLGMLRRLEPAPATINAVDPIATLRALGHAAKAAGRHLVLVLNEIDGLLVGDRSFVASLRGLHDSGMRFIMVGYATAAWELRDPQGPLYHFAHGDRPQTKAANLAALEEEEALELIGKLTAPPLPLRWQTGEEPEAVRLLLERSFRIPWVLQTYCGAIVARVERERRHRILLDDVRAVTEQDQPLLAGFDDLLYEKLLGPGHKPQHAGRQRSAARAVLAALAQRHYFEAGGPIYDSNLTRVAPETIAFSANDARRILLDYLVDLCSEDEVKALKNFFSSFPFARLLDGLCLTLILLPVERDRHAGVPLYCFQMHLYPLELKRDLGLGTPIDRLLSAVAELLTRL